ncbi:hypothetical protein L9F63_006391, partial [Diploptera punctata]
MGPSHRWTSLALVLLLATAVLARPDTSAIYEQDVDHQIHRARRVAADYGNEV